MLSGACMKVVLCVVSSRKSPRQFQEGAFLVGHSPQNFAPILQARHRFAQHMRTENCEAHPNLLVTAGPLAFQEVKT